jgi:hypothetical protein
VGRQGKEDGGDGGAEEFIRNTGREMRRSEDDFIVLLSFVQERWHWMVLEGDVTLGYRVFIMEHFVRHMKVWNGI